MIMLRGGCRWGQLTHVEQTEVEVDFTKLRILLALLLSFVLGCFLGALSFGALGESTLLLPALVTGITGILYTCFREQLKKAFQAAMVKKLHEEIDQVQDILGHSTRAQSRKLTPLRERRGEHHEDQ